MRTVNVSEFIDGSELLKSLTLIINVLNSEDIFQDLNMRESCELNQTVSGVTIISLTYRG